MNAHGKRIGCKRSMVGMTLVESMMALMVLGMGVTGAVSLVMSSVKQAADGNSHYVAAVVCNGRMERAKMIDFTDLSTLAESNTIVNDSGAPDAAGSYRRTTSVSNVTANLKQVTVFVEVKDKTSQTWSKDTGKQGTDGYAENQEYMSEMFTDYTVANSVAAAAVSAKAHKHSGGYSGNSCSGASGSGGSCTSGHGSGSCGHDGSSHGGSCDDDDDDHHGH